jgi:hypothetical protein
MGTAATDFLGIFKDYLRTILNTVVSLILFKFFQFLGKISHMQNSVKRFLKADRAVDPGGLQISTFFPEIMGK